ncbi:uncharacterized protein A4U43_C08F19600 [Asparagus officinalis]|nr:uncharacterized protein A4U43_C08F19600 [Asparagus officinalis]
MPQTPMHGAVDYNISTGPSDFASLNDINIKAQRPSPYLPERKVDALRYLSTGLLRNVLWKRKWDDYTSLAAGVYLLRLTKLSTKCFQDLLLKDQNHLAALINYAVIILCKYGSVVPGPGANAGEGAYVKKVEAGTVAKDCLLATLRADPKAGPLWVNLANAYQVVGDYRNAKKCLEQTAKLEPNQMSAHHAVATHRIKDAKRSQVCTEQRTCYRRKEKELDASTTLR